MGGVTRLPPSPNETKEPTLLNGGYPLNLRESYKTWLLESACLCAVCSSGHRPIGQSPQVLGGPCFRGLRPRVIALPSAQLKEAVVSVFFYSPVNSRLSGSTTLYKRK
jgi:hypothetical protein